LLQGDFDGALFLGYRFHRHPCSDMSRRLDAQWLSDALRTVVTARAGSGIVHGVLPFQLLKTLWRPYAPAMRVQLLELMKRFELMFQISDDAGLVPCLLPALPLTAPEIPSGAKRLTRRFIFQLLPANLFPLLLVRTHKYTLSRGAQMHSCSSVGCWLAKNEQLAHIKVTAESSKSSIDIDVYGSAPDNFFDILCDALENVLAEPSFENLEVQRRVPCPQCSQTYFDLTKLRDKLKAGKTEVDCPECDHTFKIQDLLHQIEIAPAAVPAAGALPALYEEVWYSCQSAPVTCNVHS